jgi:hypothetical protein
VAAQDGGSVDFHPGVGVSGNHGGGVTARDGGHLTIRGDTTIENNTGNGVFLSGASSLQGGGTTVSGNSGDGIHLKDTSVAQFDGTSQITGNSGWGIFCEGPPSVAVIEGNPGTVSGNTGGQNNCPSA